MKSYSEKLPPDSSCTLLIGLNFLIGTAERLDLESKHVVVATGNGERAVGFDILILATGTRTTGGASFKGIGSYEATRNALHDIQDNVKKATSIVIGGAGVTGVETAGELGFEYGTQKNITVVCIRSTWRATILFPLSNHSLYTWFWAVANRSLQISGGAQILERTPASVSRAATNELKNLKVNLKLETKGPRILEVARRMNRAHTLQWPENHHSPIPPYDRP